MGQTSVAIVGGGAAGVMAAISAAKAGLKVTVCERLAKPGKKVLASGGGRCNFTNVRLDETFFHEEDRPFVKGVLDRFGKEDIDLFFRDLGLWSYAGEDGRVFPVSNRSQTVMDVLQNEMDRLGVHIELEFDVRDIRAESDRFQLNAKGGKTLSAERVILCSGGKSYPALGSDGHGYVLAASFGHSIIEPVPITLPVIVKDPWCHQLQGQKVKGRAAAVINGKTHEWIEGDILFAQYGLSGTAIFDCTDPISLVLNRGQKAKTEVAVDFIPFMTEEELTAEFKRKISKGFSHASLIDGLLSPKFAAPLKDYLQPGKESALAALLKKRLFKVDATRGWNEAEFTAGGVDIHEVDAETLESKKQKGLFFAGEILNVQGRRGGYNLAWAWASGHIAGQSLLK